MFFLLQIQSLPDEKLRLAFQQVIVLSFYDLFVDFNRAKQYLDVCEVLYKSEPYVFDKYLLGFGDVCEKCTFPIGIEKESQG